VLTDMRLPDGDGVEIVKFIQKYKPQMPVAVITAYGNVEGAVNTLKAGAFDYVSKPIDLKMLRDLVKTALSMQNPPTEKPDEDLLVGESLVMQQLRENIHKLARSQAPVFIQGASGVGKELVAQLIHVNGPRKDKPFIPVN
ncbi:sigma-54-dependent Fis family transcriptional regulator, partial [Pseudomonas syringae pv. pisi]